MKNIKIQKWGNACSFTFRFLPYFPYFFTEFQESFIQSWRVFFQFPTVIFSKILYVSLPKRLSGIAPRVSRKMCRSGSLGFSHKVHLKISAGISGISSRSFFWISLWNSRRACRKIWRFCKFTPNFRCKQTSSGNFFLSIASETPSDIFF